MDTRPAGRRFPGGWAVIAALVASACGSTASLSDQPTDLDSGRSLARTVADQAGCRDLEDYSPIANDYWEFTCRMGDVTFLIRTATSAASRDAGTPNERGIPYKKGEFFLVSPPLQAGGDKKAAGDPVPADKLDAFPGDLINQ